MTGGVRGSRTGRRIRQYWHNRRWHDVTMTFKGQAGGTYIDVYFQGRATPLEVINVFDYEKGESRLTHLQSSFDGLIDRWLELRDREEIDESDADTPLARDWLRNYVENNY